MQRGLMQRGNRPLNSLLHRPLLPESPIPFLSCTFRIAQRKHKKINRSNPNDFQIWTNIEGEGNTEVKSIWRMWEDRIDANIGTEEIGLAVVIQDKCRIILGPINPGNYVDKVYWGRGRGAGRLDGQLNRPRSTSPILDHWPFAPSLCLHGKVNSQLKCSLTSRNLCPPAIIFAAFLQSVGFCSF